MPVVIWKNINALRGVAIGLVVLNHSAKLCFDLARRGEPPAAAVQVLELVVRAWTEACVPAFLFVSGFLLFRFNHTWRVARTGARNLLLRYLGWALPLCGLLLLAGRIGWGDLPVKLLVFGPFPAYWFLVLYLQLFLLTPLLYRLVLARPVLAAGLASSLLLASAAAYYLAVARIAPGLPLPLERLFPLHLPFFLGGMLLSASPALAGEWLGRHRRLLGRLFLLFLGSSLAESFLLGRLFPWGPDLPFHFGAQRLTLAAMALAGLLWQLSREVKAGRWRSRLESLGGKTLVVLLAMDLSLQGLLWALWHLPAKAGLAQAAALPGEPPAWLAAQGLLVLPAFFAVGLAVPLALWWLAGRLLGRRAQVLLFG